MHLFSRDSLDSGRNGDTEDDDKEEQQAKE